MQVVVTNLATLEINDINIDMIWNNQPLKVNIEVKRLFFINF